MNVLFVCTGNKMRSVAAELMAKDLSLGKNQFDSCGLSENSAKGFKVPKKVAELLDEFYDIKVPEDKRSKRINSDLVKWADYVLYMQPSHGEELQKPKWLGPKIMPLAYFCGNEKSLPRKIPDPAFIPDEEEFKEVFKLIHRCVETFLETFND